MERLRIWLAVSILWIGCIQLSAQPVVDGFMKGKSNMDLALGASYETFGSYFGAMNETVPISRSTAAFNIFAAGGITNWLDAQINVPYVSTQGTFSGMQDFSGFLKFSLLNKYYESGASLRIILAAGYFFPMTSYNTESLYSIGQQAQGNDARLVVQVMRPNGFFLMFQGGHTYREDPTPSSYASAIKVGWAKEKHYIDIWYDQQMAVGGNDYLDYRDEIADNGSTEITFRSLGVSYGKIGFTYYRPLGTYTGLAAGFSQVVWGRNVGQASMLSVSFIKKFAFGNK